MMRLKTAITKKDIVIVLVCLIFTGINVGAISSGRRRAKRILCLTNLKQLTLAWTQYAYDNDGKLVNGDTEDFPPINEPPWVFECWACSPEEQKTAIKEGALWPYCVDLKLYKCPLGLKGETQSYSAFDAMNFKGWDSFRVMLKKITDILNPSERAVFLDDSGNAGASLGGWTQYSIYSSDRWVWWDPPPIRHEGGTTLSFSDGHTEYWK
jgi:hypothetical protein